MPWSSPAVRVAHGGPGRWRPAEQQTVRAECPDSLSPCPCQLGHPPCWSVCCSSGKAHLGGRQGPGPGPVLCSLELGGWSGSGGSLKALPAPPPHPCQSPSHLIPPTQCSTGLVLAGASEGGSLAEGKSRAITWMTTGRNRERQSLPRHQGRGVIPCPLAADGGPPLQSLPCPHPSCLHQGIVPTSF